ncbi:MAG: hypothetical protein K0R99_4303 [Microbacterium sp.]|jgi:hypothetical protein|uniref:hypothetical protein n=1 Tax=Microbacterium sp. TaxID=51671 RepID=UPI00262F9416|nr:hypothetical protein [Microbacterium sp.]MDF2562857.1 hypothetical protein [Microbacterium sp.]
MAEQAAPDPEAARASYEKFQAEEEAKLEKAREAKKAELEKTRRAEIKAQLKAQKAERAEAAAVITDPDAEAASKEASVPAGDPRGSVFDAAPGKSLDEVLENKAQHDAGLRSDVPDKPKPVQYFVVTDEPDLLVVARKLGLSDHAELGAVNGRYSSNYGVQPGQRVVLPAHYTFVDIDGVVTEGEEAEELAGSEPSA